MSIKEDIAKLSCQYAGLIADKNIDNYWKTLILTGTGERWLDCADQTISLLKAEIEKMKKENPYQDNPNAEQLFLVYNGALDDFIAKLEEK